MGEEMRSLLSLREKQRGVRGRWLSISVLVGLLLCGIAGCGGSEGVTVSGTVTYQGKPVPRGLINFLPAQGEPRGGPIASDGSYTCQLPPGEYRVIVSAPPEVPEGWKEGDPPPSGPPAVPFKYAAPQTSGRTATIAAEETEKKLDFPLN